MCNVGRTIKVSSMILTKCWTQNISESSPARYIARVDIALIVLASFVNWRSIRTVVFLAAAPPPPRRLPDLAHVLVISRSHVLAREEGSPQTSPPSRERPVFMPCFKDLLWDSTIGLEETKTLIGHIWRCRNATVSICLSIMHLDGQVRIHNTPRSSQTCRLNAPLIHYMCGPSDMKGLLPLPPWPLLLDPLPKHTKVMGQRRYITGWLREDNDKPHRAIPELLMVNTTTDSAYLHAHVQ